MNTRLTKGLISIFMILGLLPSLPGQTVFVSPQGNDRNPGTKEKPVSSFVKAQALARKFSRDESVSIIFARGIYYLPQTVEFTDGDGKNASASVTYMAEVEGQAILSGGSLLNLEWQNSDNGIFVAEVPENTIIDQLYVNGLRQRMARFPNAIADKNVFDTWDLSHSAVDDPSNDPLTPGRIARWKNPEGGYIHAMHAALWGDMHWIIKGKNADGTLNFEGGWQNNRPSSMHPVYRMVENIFEELDAPGEWFFNARESRLYFMPEPGADLKTATVEIVRLRHLIEFTGSKENPVRSVHLKGFVFRHAARTFMDNKEPLLRSDWTVYRGGAVVFNGSEDCSITDCEFDQVGGNTIFVNNYNRRITIRGCYIHNSGANGIAFVGDPATVRSPIFRYGNQDYQKIDRTPGPKGDNFPEDCLVEDCLITKTGRDEKQTAPVQISMSHKIRINHCSIYDVPRAGINISEGTFGGHIIENCDVFNTVLETGDHGSFNSWGRDRYWTPDVKETCAEVAKEPTMPFWDMMGPNIIRNSRWRCDHGWDIDLDDGSTQYRIYNNLLLNGGLKMREGYDRIATNNIIINNGLHPHVWNINSGDVFKNNIVFKEYQPAIMDNAIAPDGKWGKELDYNFYVANQETMRRFAKNGCDRHSIHGDPLFINATKGDFRVKEGSPALNLGFINFPMDQFGVTKPSLKAIAKTPEMPVVAL
ncbi:MAG: right-handed parallel beta-helix repeat-containing protein [Bacteroidia bacterium]|nr:right-handed parallel beta-helix repeat-containing protein [Bacteroidia bacterium]